MEMTSHYLGQTSQPAAHGSFNNNFQFDHDDVTSILRHRFNITKQSDEFLPS